MAIRFIVVCVDGVTNMGVNRSYLGHCGRCGARVPRGNRLITYRDERGESATYAECPNCETVVHPE